ncbi:MAG: hypothetical protein FJX67_02495 [Alphaproteobacteria bacterium]|nr:hypothetical protein [Alphaproteobacteria bacterium]
MGSRTGEVLLEFHRIGNAVKVTAIDAATLVEVSIVGAARSSEAELTRIAINKLTYVISRRRDGRGTVA